MQDLGIHKQDHDLIVAMSTDVARHLGSYLVLADKKLEAMAPDNKLRQKVIDQAEQLRQLKLAIEDMPSACAEVFRFDLAWAANVEATHGPCDGSYNSRKRRTFEFRSSDSSGYSYTRQPLEHIASAQRHLMQLAQALPTALNLEKHWGRLTRTSLQLPCLVKADRRAWRKVKGWGLHRRHEDGHVAKVTGRWIASEMTPRNANLDNWEVDPYPVWFSVDGHVFFKLRNAESGSESIIRASVVHNEAHDEVKGMISHKVVSLDRWVSSRQMNGAVYSKWHDRRVSMLTVRRIFDPEYMEDSPFVKLLGLMPLIREHGTRAVKELMDKESEKERAEQAAFEQRVEDYKASLRFMGVPEDDIHIDEPTMAALRAAAIEAMNKEVA